MRIQNGSLHLFRLFGVDVFLHWSWLLVAVVQVYAARNNVGLLSHAAHPIAYHVAIYLSLFCIVLIHEFGHSLACKSVGGKAERIILWPLGGVAFVQPPPRPGALLWSIAAGPLVNVILLPLTIAPAMILGAHSHGTLSDFLSEIALINFILLVFNMLPFYPLDGGQILRALAWFVFGRGMSLMIAAIVGMAGAGLLILLALFIGSPWMALLVAFMGFQCYRALRLGNLMRRIDVGPRYVGVQCPACHEAPPVGDYWQCRCGNFFDTFGMGGQCLRCGQMYDTTACPFCGISSARPLWQSGIPERVNASVPPLIPPAAPPVL